MDDNLLDEIQQGTDIILSTSSFDNITIEDPDIPEFVDLSFEDNNLDIITNPIIIPELDIKFNQYKDLLDYIESNITINLHHFKFNIKLKKYNIQLHFRDKKKIYDYFHQKFNLQKYREAYITFYS